MTQYSSEFCIKKLEEKFVDAVFEIETSMLGKTSKEAIEDTLENPNLNYFVLIKNEKVIGFFECLIIAPVAELYDIAVEKEFQRKGLGKFMLDEFEKFAKENRCETILLEVNKINQPAISLYQKSGYVTYGERKNYYGDSDAILMKKLI